jgi:hypothetical protein
MSQAMEVLFLFGLSNTCVLNEDRANNFLIKDVCRHFQLGWASVDRGTPIQVHQEFCVCVKELITWITTPLQILYVNDIQKSHKGASPVLVKPKTKAYFAFGSGTLKGHLLVSNVNVLLTSLS